MSAANPDKLHVLTIDYRGFGYSSGQPSEPGLIKDGIAAVRWALEVAQIPPERISIVGQSLGSAVTLAVAEHYASLEPKIEFGSVITVAGFSSMPELVTTYSIAGFIPVLSPLSVYPQIQKFFVGYVRETWENDRRLANLIKASTKLNLFMLHAKNDNEISSQHCDMLFYAIANATIPATEMAGLESIWAQQRYIDGIKQKRDFGGEGYMNSWPASRANGNRIEQWVVSWGGKIHPWGLFLLIFKLIPNRTQPDHGFRTCIIDHCKECWSVGALDAVLSANFFDNIVVLDIRISYLVSYISVCWFTSLSINRYKIDGVFVEWLPYCFR